MNTQKRDSRHQPVMLSEVLTYFQERPLKVFFEGTVGAAGHARALLESHPEIETYIACDRDPEALELARENLKSFQGKVQFIHGNFADLDRHLAKYGITEVDGFFLIWESHLCS